ncbi:MAG: bifunctional phosphopantothenoylcysteine decarboxylase/phosphopantothenate--cysteine ligase CoaBC [Bacteroidales bacterium]|nr:bifunctional phosphopantothenoylcysteine decarboxylase/phosphopantothenate--cysteine ligase CoaBC [Bacteroidales bacterium]
MKGKKILLGITGGIAAYKAAILIRLLIKKEAEVQVITTPFAEKFITPLTLATLSKRPVLKMFYNPENGDWNSHVDLGLWADAFIIAPATANTIGKAANGIADNLLLTTYLSAKCPVFWAPAMDLDMFKHTAVQSNIAKLKSFGNHIIDAETGELASGLEGKGRMAEPEQIVEKIETFFNSKKKLNNFKVLITAGPTHEKIDPVRFIGNNSSGKMGFALAETLAENGGDITLISGPVSIKPINKSINLINVESADEMYKQTKKHFNKQDIIIFAAAVADYTPKHQKNSKIKKKTDSLNIELIPTKDIAAELSNKKRKNQLTVGFALETDNELKNAQQKIKNKNFDFIVLNSLKDKGAGFAFDTNKITVIDKDNNIQRFELKSKKEVAEDITATIIELIYQ